MLSRFKARQSDNCRSGLCIEDARIAFASVQRIEGSRDLLRACAFRGNARDNDWRQRAEARIKGVDLRRPPVSAVLPFGAYHTLLVEVPNVPPEEITAALRFRIKDLIDYPIDDTVIEIFEMPQQASAAKKPMVYAVAALRSSVQEQVDIVTHNRLPLDVIDIPELCIRNIAIALPQDREGVAFLHFTESSGILTVTRQGVLYLIRRIDYGRSDMASAERDEVASDEIHTRISLEIQRSLDYYESHYDRKPIGELVIGPGAGLEKLATALNDQLGLTVSALDLTELFDMPDLVSVEEQGNCLHAVGAAMRAAQEAA